MNLLKISQKYRKELFQKFVLLNQGHPGSIFSMMDIVVTLYFNGFIKYDRKTKKFFDKLIISKGHATSAIFPILRDFGLIKKKEWDNWGTRKKSNLRIFGNTSINGVDVTSGSLGHGVGIGAGLAYSNKVNKKKNKIFVIISEGELYEGSTWEALQLVSNYNLNNLVIIIDINSLIILGRTENCLKLNPIKKKIEAFNFTVSECNGHNFQSITKALKKKTKKPLCVLAKTVKGKGFSMMENKNNWHYWNRLTKEEIDFCLREVS